MSTSLQHPLQYPLQLQKFPRHSLTFGPTPIQPLKRLSAHLGGKVQLYAKREDCNSGLAFGGNKTRKLEYLIPEALAQGCDTLVSIGGIQSNQTRQVAAVAAHLGMKCVLVQENWVNYSDAVYDRVGNIEMSRIMGADVRLDAAGFDIGIRPSWEQAMDDVRKAGGKPFPIPAGCSEHPNGGLGFVGFAERCARRKPNSAFNSTTSWSALSRAARRPAWWWASRPTAGRTVSSALTPRPNPRKPVPRFCASHRTPPSWWN
jgi:1-aminocyclopropane-1-carboxylate deaminase